MKVIFTLDEYKISFNKIKRVHRNKKNLQLQNKSINILPSTRNILKLKNIPSTRKNILNIQDNHKNKKALFIGITYENTKYQLNGCINDIMLMKNLLEKRGFTSTILTEKSDIKPTKNNILLELEKFLSNTRDGDILYIHYSGHGSHILDKNSDEKDGRDETIVTSDLLNITDDEIHHLIKTKLNTKSKLFAVFDSCHSGSMLDLKYMFNNDKLEKINEDHDLIPSVLLISGCKDDQYSIEVTTVNGSNGILTTALHGILSKLNNSNAMSWNYLYSNIEKTLKSIGASQHPQLSSGSIINLHDKIFI